MPQLKRPWSDGTTHAVMSPLEFTPQRWDDYTWWLEQGRRMAKRVKLLTKDVLRTPFEGLG